MSQVNARETGTPDACHQIVVCHICSGDLWAGAEVQAATLIKKLSQESSLKLLVIVLNEGRLAEEARACGAEVKVLPENELGFWAIFNEAMDFLRGRKIDIVHTHRYKENLLGAMLARWCRISILIRTQHGMPESPDGTRSVKQGFLRMLDKWVAVHRNHKIIGVSAELSERLNAYLGSRNIVTVLNGIDIEASQSSLTRSEAKEKFGFPSHSQLIGIVGRLEPIKRVDIFLAAAQRILADLPNTNFVVAGDGGLRAELERMSQSMGIEDRVRFLGHCSSASEVLRSLDLLVICSDHEGLPMVLLEALSLKVPVVARAVGGIREVIEDGKNGVLVESSAPEALAAACCRLLSSEAGVRERIAEAGFNTVSTKFSADKTANQVINLYRELLTKK